jgi:hypothetical protein
MRSVVYELYGISGTSTADSPDYYSGIMIQVRNSTNDYEILIAYFIRIG